MIPAILITLAADHQLTADQVATILKTRQIQPAKFQTELIQSIQNWVAILDQLTNKETKLAEADFGTSDSLNQLWQSWLATASITAIQHQMSRFVADYQLPLPTVAIRCATNPSAALRDQIRNHFKNHLVLFEIDTALLGGMQIYHQHKLFDHSWQGRLTALNALL